MQAGPLQDFHVPGHAPEIACNDALGFAHEQNRPDTPAACTQAPQGSNGDTVVGAFDWDSVMNYCNTVRNGRGILSWTDVVGVRQVYGGNGLRSPCFTPLCSLCLRG